MGKSKVASISPKSMAARYRVAVSKIYEWIESCELRAINTASSPEMRPRYAILTSDLEKFEAARSSTAASVG